MKPTQITMQIVKNLGNYETARLECTYTLNEGDELPMCFRNARYELEKAYATAYEKKQPATREELSVTHSQFIPVCKALHENRVGLTELQKFYVINKEAFEYFIKHKLI